jgi:hypothetical protein
MTPESGARWVRMSRNAGTAWPVHPFGVPQTCTLAGGGLNYCGGYPASISFQIEMVQNHVLFAR